MNVSRLFSSLCLWALLLCAATNLSAQQNDFISYLNEQDVNLSPEGKQRLDSLKARPTSISVRLIEFQKLSQLASQPQLRIPLANAGTQVATRRRIRQPEALKLLWSGVLQQDGKNPVFFSVVDSSVTGMIHLEQGVFAIEPLEAGYHVLIELDQSKFGPDEPPDTTSTNQFRGNEEKQVNLTKGGGENSSASTANLDVLVAYTPAVASASGNIASLIAACEQSANETLSNSNVNAQVSVVHSVQVSYTESGSTNTDIGRLQGTSDGYMDNIHSLRDLSGADVVVLLISYANNANGEAFQIPASSSTAFCVVVDDAAVSNYTFAHEIGHLIGCYHDNDTRGTYEHGYRYAADNWRTVMAIPLQSPDPVLRIPYWSNPNETYGDVAMGTTSTNDNARKWNERAATVAGFESPMYVTITGPTDLKAKTSGTWTANPSAAGYTYAYEWRYRNAGATNWSAVVSTAKTYTRLMPGNDIELQAKAGTQGIDAYDTHYVKKVLKKEGTSAEETDALPESFSLSQNYPNPFNPETIIRFDLPGAAQVQLVIFDLAGHEVRRLVDANMAAGYHQALWDGKDSAGNHVPSGV